MEYPLLYREDYVWSMRVIKMSDDVYKIVTEHGKSDGKMVSHERVIDRGKGKKSVFEQAKSEALSKWRAQIEKKGYSETKGDAGIVKVYPMLANKYVKDKTKLRFPLMVQRKYDGVRCLAFCKNGKVFLMSRQGKFYNNLNHIREELMSIMGDRMDGYYMDGELYSDELPFERISGVTRLLDENPDIDECKIGFHVYDGFWLDNLEQSFIDRWTLLANLIENMRSIKCVETLNVDNMDEVMDYHSKFVSEGYEGIMIRDPSKGYTLRKRSNALLKYKEFVEDEYIIVGYTEGDGDDKGLVIWECETREGKRFRVRPRGTREYRAELFSTGESYIGKYLTVIYQELTGDGIPRFPVGKDIRDGY